ncbi:hypothetical protein AB0I81_49310 [Nonomuraea sp. NPDC050404]|uniref:hypothetical protein n=1 Tax=Nonomuraea sp. NPDC050404 TaxID=3155783 RepID=UPI0033D356B3
MRASQLPSHRAQIGRAGAAPGPHSFSHAGPRSARREAARERQSGSSSKTLLLRRAFGRLREGEEAELRAADPRDLRAGRWFRWVWLGGLLVVAAWLGFFVLPVLAGLLQWAAAELASGVRFWHAVAGAGLLVLPWLVTTGLWLKARRATGRPA